MKRNIFILFSILLLSCLLICTDAKALGLGFYTDLPIHEGSGDNSVEFNTRDQSLAPYYDHYDDYDFNSDDENHSFGFVLDTALASNTLFNYRLNLGYGSWKWKPEFGGKFKFDAYTMDNTFGFSFYRDRLIRLWAGPQIRFALLNGKYINSNGIKDNNWNYSYFGFGFAPVIGLNFNPGNAFTASMTMGYRFMIYDGNEDYRGDRANVYDDAYKYKNREQQFFMNIAIFFRIHDKF